MILECVVSLLGRASKTCRVYSSAVDSWQNTVTTPRFDSHGNFRVSNRGCAWDGASPRGILRSKVIYSTQYTLTWRFGIEMHSAVCDWSKPGFCDEASIVHADCARYCATSRG